MDSSKSMFTSKVIMVTKVFGMILLLGVFIQVSLIYLDVVNAKKEIMELSYKKFKAGDNDLKSSQTIISQIPYKKVEGIPSVFTHEEKEPYKRAYNLKRDTFTQRIPIFTEIMKPYLSSPSINYLEVGVFEGGSMAWMLDNILISKASRAVGIDTFRDKTQKQYFGNIKLTGKEDQVTTIKGKSQEAMRTLPLNSFDLIYIDGSHSSPDVLEDAILASRLLKVGGTIIFDDYGHAYNHPWIEVAAALDIFFKLYGDKFELVQRDFLVILKKVKA